MLAFLSQDDVFSCYNIMRRLGVEKFKIPKVVISPDLSPTQMGPNDVLDNSLVTSAVSNKRKRLALNTSDQSCVIPDDKRLC